MRVLLNLLTVVQHYMLLLACSLTVETEKGRLETPSGSACGVPGELQRLFVNELLFQEQQLTRVCPHQLQQEAPKHVGQQDAREIRSSSFCTPQRHAQAAPAGLYDGKDSGH